MKKNVLINDWITFVTVVEMGSFSAAATELSVSTGTVSKNLTKLENTIGAQLISRNAHKCELTESGKIAYEKSIIICEAYSNLLARIDGIGNEIKGVMRLSAPSIICDNIASQWIMEYIDLNPGVSIHLLSRDSGNFTADSPEFDDLVLKSGYLNNPDLIHRSLNPVPFGIYASPDYLSKHKPIKFPEEMSGHSFLRLSHPYLKPPLILMKNGESRKIEFTPGKEMVSNNVFSLINMATENRGICLAAPVWAVKEQVDSGLLIHLLPEWRLPELQVHLVWRYRKHYSPLFRDFSTFIEKKWNSLFA
ncbi:LysR family transcriptional regulator [Erwinia sp. HDF1-3R]|uniref:LysR family transcriptional regulator n=1 Tax=Erwinia sp. HDF1-3R TaxID=3141543 RepID=UPI0031F4E3E8